MSEAPEVPAQVTELADACVAFVTAKYGARLDFEPDTLSLLDQWLRDAREQIPASPEAGDLVQAAAGAYLGEVIRRQFGGEWSTNGHYADWRLHLTSVYCAFNPIGMAREALLLGEAEGWHAHFDVDPAEKEAVHTRLEALPKVSEDEYYAPSTRFDVVSIVVEALRESLRAQGLGDVTFALADYDGHKTEPNGSPPRRLH